MALEVPTFVVITKSDLCSPEQMSHTMKQLEQTLSMTGRRKVPFKVTNESDACTAAQRFSETQ